MPLLLSEQVALVTGGGRGIGRAIAFLLAEHGARVALLARTAMQLDEVVGSLRSSGGDAVAIPADVNNDAALASAIEQVRRQLGSPSILINNAGWAPPRTKLAHTRLTDVDAMLATNLRAPIRLTRELLPDMLARKRGWIVNLASAFALHPHSGEAVYAATKAALLAFSHALATECAATGVHVAALCPGYVDTDLIPSNRRVDRDSFLRPVDVARAALAFVLDEAGSDEVEIPIAPGAAQ